MIISLKNEEYCEKILKEYKSNKSTYQIAESLGTYPNRIKRDLIKLGIKIRDRSESQKAALKTGRKRHPTEGTKRGQEVKLKISKKMEEFWNNLDETELEKRSATAKKRWDSLSVEERTRMQALAAQGLREAAKYGSTLEKEILKVLTEKGFSVEHQKEDLLPNEKMHIDIYLPKVKTAIEIDGPTHFLPIWGEERLKKTMLSDAKKTGLLISKKIQIIRLKVVQKKVSQNRQQEICDELIRLLSLKKRKNFIEIEV